MTMTCIPDQAAEARLRAIGRALREARGEMSQEELGMRLHVPQTTISRWERGTVDFGVEQLRAIETALGLVPGRLAAAGGYVACDDIPQDVFRIAVMFELEDVIRLMAAASELDLGIRVTNSLVPDTEEGDVLVEQWEVELSQVPRIDAAQ